MTVKLNEMTVRPGLHRIFVLDRNGVPNKCDERALKGV